MSCPHPPPSLDSTENPKNSVNRATYFSCSDFHVLRCFPSQTLPSDIQVKIFSLILLGNLIVLSFHVVHKHLF